MAWGAFLFCAGCLHVFLIARHYRWYRRTRIGRMLLTTGRLDASRAAGFATGLAIPVLALLLLNQRLAFTTGGALAALFCVVLAVGIAFIVRDVQRYKLAHPREVARLRAEPSYMTHKLWWRVATPLAVAGFLFPPPSHLHLYLVFAICLKVSHTLLDGLSRVAFQRPFKPPSRGEYNLDVTWSDWLLLLPWMGLAVWTGLLIRSVSYVAHGDPQHARWPWP